MEALFSLFYSGGMEGTTGFLLPYQRQQQQMMMGWCYFPTRPMMVVPLSYSLTNPFLFIDQSLANVRLQVRSPYLNQARFFFWDKKFV